MAGPARSVDRVGWAMVMEGEAWKAWGLKWSVPG